MCHGGFDGIEVNEPPEYTYVPKPDDGVLDSFESKHGFKLPASYRRFCLRFGAGELAKWVRVASPMATKYEMELAEFNQQSQEELEFVTDYGPKEMTSQFYYFASTIGGESFVWVLSEVTDLIAHEFKIYLLERVGPAVPFADSFSQFVEKVTGPMIEGDGSIWQPEKKFTRFME